MDIQTILNYVVHTKYNTNPNAILDMLKAMNVSKDAQEKIIEYVVHTIYNINPNDLAAMIANGIIEDSEESSSYEESEPIIK